MGVLGNAELALHMLPNESPARDNLQRIEAAAMSAADLGRQMLDKDVAGLGENITVCVYIAERGAARFYIR